MKAPVTTLANKKAGDIDLDDLRYPDRAVHLLGRGLAGGDESSGWGGGRV